ncbi:MAG TPA: thiamine pyrophosphate-dependent enzyme [bacterium]|nr:thiamine pyrophosphate-dependent enzyme [bacterium]
MNSIFEKTEEYIYEGNRSCAGCGLSLAFRLAMKALGEKTIIVVPACCFTVYTGVFPFSPIKVPVINTAFETTAAVASGIEAALKVKNKKDINVVGWAGDGGTFDIGLQSLSAACARNANIIYVCYDNEAYMNTGTQGSGATPYKALTTTTPIKGKTHNKKDLIGIIRAHNIPYIATASPSYPQDLFNKFEKAKTIYGTKFIYILSPCPPGWGYETDKTVLLGRLAVQSGLFDLFEIENGILNLTAESKSMLENKKIKKDVSEYLKLQKRFSHINDDDVQLYRNFVNEKWNNYFKMFEKK